MGLDQLNDIFKSLDSDLLGLKQAVDLLREIEWEGRNMGRSACPACGGLQPYSPPFKHEFVLRDETPGHHPDCRLAALLAKHPEGKP